MHMLLAYHPVICIIEYDLTMKRVHSLKIIHTYSKLLKNYKSLNIKEAWVLNLNYWIIMNYLTICSQLHKQYFVKLQLPLERNNLLVWSIFKSTYTMQEVFCNHLTRNRIHRVMKQCKRKRYKSHKDKSSVVVKITYSEIRTSAEVVSISNIRRLSFQLHSYVYLFEALNENKTIDCLEFHFCIHLECRKTENW